MLDVVFSQPLGIRHSWSDADYVQVQGGIICTALGLLANIDGSQGYGMYTEFNLEENGIADELQLQRKV